MTFSYLTEIFRPAGLSAEAVAKLLAKPLGADEVNLRLALRRDPPAIVGLHDARGVDAAVAALRAAGGDGLAVSHDDLAALGPSRKIRDLRIDEGGAFEAELWREGRVRLDPADIDVIVRGSLSETTTSTHAPAPAWHALGPALRGSAMHIGFGYGGAHGWAVHRHMREQLADRSAMDRRTSVSHKLDLHVARFEGAPAVFQIDGDKFGFRVLGAMRGHGDKVNIDRMCELVAHLAPEVVVDPYFALWNPPPAHDRLRLPQMAINKDDPAYAFYSRWAALVYRRVGEG